MAVFSEVCMVYWDPIAAHSYLYGSVIRRTASGAVVFENEQMPSGVAIHEWFSKTEFGTHKTVPQLPILLPETWYRVKLQAESVPKHSVYVRMEFYNYQEELIDFLMFRDVCDFECPEDTYSYRIQLIQGGSTCLTFSRISIQRTGAREIIRKDSQDRKRGLFEPKRKEKELEKLRKEKEKRMKTKIKALCDEDVMEKEELFSFREGENAILFLEPQGCTYRVPDTEDLGGIENLAAIVTPVNEDSVRRQLRKCKGKILLIGYGEASNQAAVRMLDQLEDAEAYLYQPRGDLWEEPEKKNFSDRIHPYGEKEERTAARQLAGSLRNVSKRLHQLPFCEMRGVK